MSLYTIHVYKKKHLFGDVWLKTKHFLKIEPLFVAKMILNSIVGAAAVQLEGQEGGGDHPDIGGGEG